MLIKRDWKYCAVAVLLILVTALSAGFSGQLVSADQAGAPAGGGGGGGCVPTITLNVPDSAVPGGTVSVTGSIYNNGPVAGVSLGLTVKDANGAVYYTDQTTSTANGAFSLSFNLSSRASEGSTWQVFVAGGGAVASKTFTVAGANGVVTVAPASTQLGSQVAFTGQVPQGKVPVGITVRDPNGAIIYVDQTNAAADGSYSFAMVVPATAAIGTWAVDVAGGGTTGHEVFTVASTLVPVLARITVSGPIPNLTVGGVVYDLNNLTRAGYDQHNNPYDISGFPVTWQIVSGASFVSLSGSNLTPVSPGTGAVTATVYGVVSDPISFTVSPSSSGSNLFVQVTDMHLCNAADAQKYLKSSPNYDPEAYASQLVTEMKSIQPSFVVNTGDLVALADSKPISKGKEWFTLYSQDIAQPLSAAGITLFNVSGNHDQGGTNYSKYKSIADVPDPDKPYYGNGLFTLMTGSKRFYSYDQGAYHYIVLDPDEIPNTTGVGFVQLSQEQMAWLQTDLQANKDKNIILFFHQPSSDWTNWSDVAKILSGYKIKMIFDGHWHLNTLVDNGFPEQSTSALCGSWWRDSVGKDGSPYGYRLVYPAPDAVYSFYKNLGSNQQINFITPEDVVLCGQAPLYAQAYDSSQTITAMEYRIDGGNWQTMSISQVSVWYEGRATMNITPDGQYHQVEVSYLGADGKRFSSSKLFKFDHNPVVDIKTIEDHFDDFRGRYATVAATVTAGLDVGNEPVLQDQSGGITAWAGECTGCPPFIIGTGLKLRGQVSTDGYSMQQLQVHSAADVTNADITTIKSPKVMTIPDVPDAYYQWIKIQGVTVTKIDDSSDFYVQDQAGHKLPIYTGDQSPAYNAQTALHLGETLDISGIAYNYNGAPEICTRIADDLIPLSPALASTVKIAVISDPHYYAPELGTSGSAFQQYLDSDRKMLAESKAILTSAITAIKNSDAQIVLVTGDLTKDGELLDHQQFAGYLKQLKDAGKKVYVIDGNHDINNPDAYSYSGDIKTPVANVTPDDFRSIYHDFGYGDAVAADVYSLSYAVDPVPGLRIIAMDSALYDTNITDNAPKTGGAFSAGRLNWIKAETADGIAKGKTVIGMMHHGVTNHFSLESQLFPDYVIQNADQVAADLAKQGMRAVFTGHFHANDITKVPNQPLFDIETGSLVTYPVPYRFVELTTDGKLKITTDRVASIDYDTKGQSFQDYARSYLAQGLSGLVPNMLAAVIMQQNPGLSVSQAVYLATNAASQPITGTSLTVKDLLVNAMIDHYQGDEHPSAQMLAIYQGMYASNDSLTKMLGGALLSLDTDLFPPDSNVALDLNSGSTMDDLVTDAISYQLAPGGTHQTVATLISKDGSTHDVTNQATYTSSNQAVATVNASGLVTTLTSGSTVITAVYGNCQETVNVTVTTVVPVITLSIPDTVVQGGAVHVTGSISNNGPVAGVSLGITVNDVNGATKYVDQTASAADGSFSFDFGIPADAPLGNWQVFVAGGGTIADQAFTVTGGGTSRTVSSAASISPITVPYGTALGNVPLPASVSITLSDGSAQSMAVTWNTTSIPAYDGNTAGGYVFTGRLSNLPAGVINPDNVTARVNVYVVTVNVSNGTATIDLSTASLTPGESPLTLDLASILPAGALQVNGTTNTTFSDALNLTLGGGVGLGIPTGTVVSGTGVLSVQSVDPGTLAVAPPSNAAVINYSFGDTEVTFSKPVTITIPAKTPGAHAYYFKNGVWIDLGAPVSVAGTAPNCVLSYAVTHFTNFTSAAPLSGTITFNPASGATIDSGNTVTLSAPGAVKILYYFSATAPGTDFGSGGQPVTISGASGTTAPITSSGYITAVFVGSNNATSPIFTAHYTISSGGGGSSGGGTPAPVAVTSITGSATVNPAAGGSVSLGSDAKVNIPAGALQGSTAVDVSVQKVSNPPGAPSGFQLLGSVYEFTVGSKASYSFVKPVTLTFTFNSTTLNPGETPSIYYYDQVKGQWVSLGGTVSGNTISVTVDHFTSFAVMAKQVAPAPVPSQVFADVPASYWASGVIDDLNSQGYISGYPDGTFGPDREITRAEFTTIIAKSLGLSEAGSSGLGFADLDTIPDWAKGYVAAAAKAGLVSGYSDGTFKANDYITRTEIAVIVAKALHASQPSAAVPAFTDAAQIPSWAAGFVAYDMAKGILSGYPDHTFQPRNRARRAEACAMIVKMLRNH